MLYYAIGTQKRKDKQGNYEVITKRFVITEESRVGAVNQALRIAKMDRITLEFVRPEQSKSNLDWGGILTKNMQGQKAELHRKQKLREKANREKG